MKHKLSIALLKEDQDEINGRLTDQVVSPALKTGGTAMSRMESVTTSLPPFMARSGLRLGCNSRRDTNL
jgi:hypothetical protein